MKVLFRFFYPVHNAKSYASPAKKKKKNRELNRKPSMFYALGQRCLDARRHSKLIPQRPVTNCTRSMFYQHTFHKKELQRVFLFCGCSTAVLRILINANERTQSWWRVHFVVGTRQCHKCARTGFKPSASLDSIQCRK